MHEQHNLLNVHVCVCGYITYESAQPLLTPPNSLGGKPDDPKTPEKTQDDKLARKPGRKNKDNVGKNTGNRKDPEEK